MIGDIGHTHKTYPNIKKLLDFIGVNIEFLNSSPSNHKFWTPYTEPSEQ